MSKPNVYPADIWETSRGVMVWADDLFARKITKSERLEVREAIANALHEERERCARIADGLRKASTPGMPLFGAGMCNAADQIAIAIRNPLPPAHKPDNDEDGFKRVPVVGEIR